MRRFLPFVRCKWTGVRLFSGSAKGAPFRVLFLGSGKIALESLQALHAARSSARPLVSELGVVVAPDRPAGRGLLVTPGIVKTFATENNLRLFEVDKDVNFRMDNWKFDLNHGYDLGLVVAFGYFLPRWLIESFPLGMLNVHPSLLPKYRGAAPIQHSLMNGDTTTGVSIIKVDPNRMDAGEIVSQPQLVVEDTDTYETLYPKVSKVGASELLRVLETWPHFSPQAQIGSVVRAPKIPNTFGKIDWAKSEAEKVHLRWRGIQGYTPLHCMFNGKRVNLCLKGPFRRRLDEDVGADLNVESNSPSGFEPRPGSIVYDGASGCLLVRCQDGGWIAVESLLIEGKPQSIGGHAFANQYIRGLSPKNTRKYFRSDVCFE